MWRGGRLGFSGGVEQVDRAQVVRGVVAGAALPVRFFSAGVGVCLRGGAAREVPGVAQGPRTACDSMYALGLHLSAVVLEHQFLQHENLFAQVAVFVVQQVCLVRGAALLCFQLADLAPEVLDSRLGLLQLQPAAVCLHRRGLQLARPLAQPLPQLPVLLLQLLDQVVQAALVRPQAVQVFGQARLRALRLPA